MSSATEAVVIALVADVMQVPSGDVTVDTTPDDLEQWDSLAHMTLVLRLEEHFGVVFSEEDMMTGLLSVRGIIGTVDRLAG